MNLENFPKVEIPAVIYCLFSGSIQAVYGQKQDDRKSDLGSLWRSPGWHSQDSCQIKQIHGMDCWDDAAITSSCGQGLDT